MPCADPVLALGVMEKWGTILACASHIPSYLCMQGFPYRVPASEGGEDSDHAPDLLLALLTHIACLLSQSAAHGSTCSVRELLAAQAQGARHLRATSAGLPGHGDLCLWLDVPLDALDTTCASRCVVTWAFIKCTKGSSDI